MTLSPVVRYQFWKQILPPSSETAESVYWSKMLVTINQSARCHRPDDLSSYLCRRVNFISLYIKILPYFYVVCVHTAEYLFYRRLTSLHVRHISIDFTSHIHCNATVKGKSF
jgi:hypothetical protein